MRLSVIMMTYNEAEFIPVSLPSLVDISDEIIALDMGSTDGTVETLKRYLRNCDMIIDYDRVNLFRFGFSHPRNYAVKYASGDLVLIVDADEQLEGTLDVIMRAELTSHTNTFSVTRQNYVFNANMGLSDTDTIIRSAEYSVEKHRRLHRRVPQVRFEGLVHEELWDGEVSAFHTAADTDLVLHHLSAFRTSRDDQNKHWLYAYLLLKAQLFQGFRFGTNEWFFNNYVPENIDILLAQANSFAEINGLQKFDKGMLSSTCVVE